MTRRALGRLTASMVALLLLAPACRLNTQTVLTQARKDDRAGRYRAACRGYYTALRRADFPARERLTTLRARVRCAHRSGTLAALRADAQRRIQRHPDSAEAHYVLALTTMVASRGSVPAALTHLRAAQKADPAAAEYAYRRGQLLLAAEHFENAMAALRSALRQKPRWAAPRIALARALAARGQIAEARRVLTPLHGCRPTAREVAKASGILSTVARDADPIPPGAGPLFRKALGLLKREFTAAAAQTLKTAHEQYPNVATFALLYGLTMVRLSNYGNALALLKKAIRLNPADFSAPMHLAAVLARLGRHKEALGHYRRACQLNPVSQRAHAGLGTTLLTLNQVAAALPLLERAAALSGRDPRAVRNLAQALATAGRLNEAIAMLRDAVKRQPKQVDARYELAEYLIRRYRSGESEAAAERDFREARALLRRLVKDAPEHTAARTLLRRLTGGAEGQKVPKRRDGWGG